MNILQVNSQILLSCADNLIAWNVASSASEAVKIPPPNLPPNLTKEQMKILHAEDRTINCIAITRSGEYIAVSTENKQVVIYNKTLHAIRNFVVKRTASKVIFSNSNDVLVADRTGDVWLYTLNEDSCEPVLLLGHLSMILDMMLSECGRYIITCDRDEKIRVSCFPNTYNIVSFCLGHKEFVMTIKVVKHVLVSASGDGTVRIWNYLKGEELNVINANEHVDDKKLLDSFSVEMDREKVDVTALPISNMQVNCNNDILFIALSLHLCSQIQVYAVNLNTCKSVYLAGINPSETPSNFYLSNFLYVLSNNSIAVYEVTSEGCTETPEPGFEGFYSKFKHLIQVNVNNTITVLYKRKFDNVMEYLERKKIRLQSSQ